ncbi:MAG: hypothetical protein ACXVFV_08055 [Mycobacteriales bacterium]
MGAQPDDLAALLRWEQHGGTWVVLSRTPDGAVLSLRRCDGGEEADRLAVTSPEALARLEER